MAKTGIRETDLYLPVKRLLETQGYRVKGEVGAADIVAIRDGDDPVIVELKAGFSLSLFHQAIQRQAISDAVYVAVPRGAGRASLKALVENRKLCRRLGLGLITVRLADGFTEIHCDPAPYKPRQSKPRKTRLLREFERLIGDPNLGGATRRNLVTGYRQEALRCLKLLDEQGPTKAAKVAQQTSIAHARRLMADNHYGWFERTGTGIYALSPKGVKATTEYLTELENLRAVTLGADNASVITEP
ncbi:DUF2161 family putative PD-(D/E)XK-type phosphodiesterase [Mesorhizobium sp. 1M-11]|uniref:DUF2161 domain-containing phosphodiesterase n=1 Tax=Mesorhizobium sp. 1M-11 TaxID=1529006 RepID=UPI0006C73D6B|nr:DUF2161 family putative PD-(D/E)XK-type phosphodiesterase [Mesorhizobium sp. 1M-11]